MEDDDFGAAGSDRDGWFSRTPGEIDDERRAAEQAGRDAYAEAVRTGQDVQARTPDELIQLGRARLARQTRAPASPEALSPQNCGGGQDALMQGDAFVRAVANKATFGLADHLAAAGDAVAGGGDLDQIWRQYQANLRQQHTRDAYDAQYRSTAHSLGDQAGEVLAFVGGGKIGAGAARRLSPAAKGVLGEGMSVAKTLGRWDVPKAFQVEEEVAGGHSILDHATLRKGEAVEAKFGPSARLRPRQREARQKLGPSYRLDRWGPQHIGLGVGALTGATSVMTDYDGEP